jgi:hypothetical protein
MINFEDGDVAQLRQAVGTAVETGAKDQDLLHPGQRRGYRLVDQPGTGDHAAAHAGPAAVDHRLDQAAGGRHAPRRCQRPELGREELDRQRVVSHPNTCRPARLERPEERVLAGRPARLSSTHRRPSS